MCAANSGQPCTWSKRIPVNLHKLAFGFLRGQKLLQGPFEALPLPLAAHGFNSGPRIWAPVVMPRPVTGNVSRGCDLFCGCVQAPENRSRETDAAKNSGGTRVNFRQLVWGYTLHYLRLRLRLLDSSREYGVLYLRFCRFCPLVSGQWSLFSVQRCLS